MLIAGRWIGGGDVASRMEAVEWNGKGEIREKGIE
jgi:hypothetical protein